MKEKIQRWMQRVRGPEPQPIVLPQKRIYVLPTRTGLFMLGTLLVLLIASVNYNLALGYALTFLFGGAGLAHILHSWRALVKLRLHIFSPTGEVFSGGGAAFRLLASQDGRRERPAICVIRGEETLAQFDVPPYGDVETTLHLATPKRGWFAVGRLTLECRAPLGWVRAWAYIEPDARALVFPLPSGDPNPPEFEATVEAALTTRSGQEEFQGLRNTLPTDAPSRIAWKSLARGSLRSKHYVGGNAPQWLLDFNALPAPLSVETRLSQLTQWVLAARQLHALTQLNLPGRQLGPANDDSHYTACLRALALFEERS